MRSTAALLGHLSVVAWLIAGVAGCGSSDTPPEAPGTPPATVDAAPPAERSAAFEAQKGALQDAAPTKDALLGKYPSPYGAATAVDPSTLAGFDQIQSQAAVALTASELALLGKNGFVVSGSKRYPTFLHGYKTIYLADAPLYISADSILHAVHRSYDGILSDIESGTLSPGLDALLVSLRKQLGSGAASALPAADADLDTYLAVALSLLHDRVEPPVRSGNAAAVKELFDTAKAAKGPGALQLFGAGRDEDFSQFQPRGHYAGVPELEKYFRAMIWLGRVDFRFLEPESGTGKLLFRRVAVEAAMALDALAGPDERAAWSKIDEVIGAFVGEHDSMILSELPALRKDLGATALGDLASRTDAEMARAILEGGYGAQRIASALIVNGGDSTYPLSSSFALFGQRYTLDSHVFSNVVFDRVSHGTVMRMMPSPLDAAFAALGNDQAATLLAPELDQYGYAKDLDAMRILVAAHEPSYWEGSLYTHWLSALRTLSPKEALAGDGLPGVVRTEAWGRRLLTTQLGSWAELRHDTLLYAKQSYTSGAGCTFPDAYVDPYPELFLRLAAFADKGTSVIASLGTAPAATRASAYFTRLHSISLTLSDMAKRERAGEALTDDQLAFVNRAITLQGGCVEAADGWYGDLFYNGDAAVARDPVIADVHTQPTDEAGNPVGHVLHVGTADPRMMAVAVETCSGPRLYVGLASSYRERVTDDFKRLTDEDWAKETLENPGPEVPWAADFVAPLALEAPSSAIPHQGGSSEGDGLAFERMTISTMPRASLTWSTLNPSSLSQRMTSSFARRSFG
jgi:hypothetical protein